MFLGRYAQNPATIENGKKVMIVSTIEEILKLLIDCKSSNLTSSLSKQAGSQAFNANKQENKKDKKESSTSGMSPACGEKSSNSQRLQRYCDVCYSIRHNTSYCCYTHTEKQTKEFKKTILPLRLLLKL